MAHTNIVQTAGAEINVEQWLQNAKLSELKSKFAADSITIEELMELSPEELVEFAKDELELKPLKRNRFIKAVKQSIVSSTIQPGGPGLNTTAATGETFNNEHGDNDDDEEDGDEDSESEYDEKKEEMREQEETILKGQQILASVMTRVDVNLQKINVFLDEGIQSESKKRLDAMHGVFELFATELMDRKSKLIDEFNAETEKQVVAIKAFQSEMNAFKQSINELHSLKRKSTIIAKQKEFIESSAYRKIKSFSLPVIDLAADEEKVVGQIKEFGATGTMSMLTANAGNNHMMDSPIPISQKNMITIQIGGCGNKMGNLFWETLKKEYMMDDELRTDSIFREDVDTYFREISDNRYLPRGIACDIAYSKVSPLLNKSNICQSHSDSSQRNIYPIAHYNVGPKLFEERIEDCIRREVELCDVFRGFQFHSNVGGGAGSGLTNLLVYRLWDEYKKKSRLYFTSFPGKQYHVPFEPYNIALGLKYQIDGTKMAPWTWSKESLESTAYLYNQNRILPICERADRTNVHSFIALDNETTHELCTKLKGKAKSEVDFEAINRIHNLMITDISSIFRLPSTTEVVMKSEFLSERTIKKWNQSTFDHIYWDGSDDEDDVNDQTVFVQRKHRFTNFWNATYCPLFLTSYQQEIDNRFNVKALTPRIMNRKHEKTDIMDRFQLIFRGNLDSHQIKQALDGRFKNEDHFKVYKVRTPSTFTKTSAVKLDNGNGWIMDRLKGILNDARTLYEKKEFLEIFLRQGMDDGEFQEAFHEIQDLLSEFELKKADDDKDEEDSDDIDDVVEEEDESDEDSDEIRRQLMMQMR